MATTMESIVRAPYLVHVERETQKTVSIESVPTPANLGKCATQAQSPLFGRIPAEIRNEIFSLALAQYEDLDNPYPEWDFSYRPGHRARRHVSTNLLLTYRRVWLEANHLPMFQATHCFWFNDHRRRPAWATRKRKIGSWIYTANWVHRNEQSRLSDFVNSLTQLQFNRLTHLQIYAQAHIIQNHRPRRRRRFSEVTTHVDGLSPSRILVFPRGALSLNTFTLTIRNCDWWARTSLDTEPFYPDVPLHLSASRIQGFLDDFASRSVSEFRLELETLSDRTEQLWPIVDELKAMAQSQKGGAPRWKLVEPLEEASWSGPTHLGGPTNCCGQVYNEYGRYARLDYRIVTMKWRSLPQVEMTEASASRSNLPERAPKRLKGLDVGPVLDAHPVSIYEKWWVERNSLLKLVD